MADRVRVVLALRIHSGRRSYMRMSNLAWVAIVGAVSLMDLFNAAKAGTMPQSSTEGSSVAVNTVPRGTHFLNRLDNELSTGKHKVNKKFEAKTLEPLEIPNGYIPRGFDAADVSTDPRASLGNITIRNFQRLKCFRLKFLIYFMLTCTQFVIKSNEKMRSAGDGIDGHRRSFRAAL